MKTVLKKVWYVKFFHTLTFSAFLVSSFSLAQAASLQVSPILVEFTPSDKAKEFWLTNTGSTKIRAQVRVQQWSQLKSQETLIPTKDLIASPLITEIKPGQRQLVRLIKPADVNISQERAFRLLVDELPDNSQQQNNSGLNILLQYSIPIFYKSSQTSKINNGVTALDSIQFKYTQGQFSAKNLSNSYIRISQLNYVAANGEKTPLIPGLMGYVLAGQAMSWTLPQKLPDNGSGKFQAVINSDIKEQALPIENK